MNKDDLIQKWLKGDLSEQEMESFKQLEDYPELTGIINNATYFKAAEFSKIDDFQTFKTRLKNTSKPVQKFNWLQPFLRIASVLVVGLVLSYFFFFDGNVEVQTIAGEKTTIELPDSSTVVINALSELSYSKKTWNEKRAVELKGEAFFKVAKGAKFDVLTSSGTVTVVGTQFNVKQRSDFFEVACFEGIVKVVSGDVIELLKAGDRLRFSLGTHAKDKTLYENPDWTNNTSSFERVALGQVFAELERQYNVKVFTKNIDTKRLFSGGFAHQGLENALRSICEPLDLAFQIDSNNKVTIFGKK